MNHAGGGQPGMPPNMMPMAPSQYNRRQDGNYYFQQQLPQHQLPHHQHHYPHPLQHQPMPYYPYYNFPGPPPVHNPYVQPYYPRPYQHQGPVIVSSHPHQHHQQAMPPMNRQTSYQSPMPPPAALPVRTVPEPSTPSVTSQPVVSPSPTETHTSISAPTPPVQESKPVEAVAPSSPIVIQSSPVSKRTPFYPKLPWFSVSESSFPTRTSRRRRKLTEFSSEQVELPSRQQSKPEPTPESENATSTEAGTNEQTSVEPQILEPTTPSESVPPSEVYSTTPTTPSSVVTTTALPPQQTQKKPAVKTAIVPIVPIKPITPIKSASPVQPRPTSIGVTNETKPAVPLESDVGKEKTADSVVHDTATGNDEPVTTTAEDTTAPEPLPEIAKALPSSWAGLFASRAAAAAAAKVVTSASTAESTPSAVNVPKAGNLAEAVREYSVDGEEKIPFLEPRGLVNTGNMCYMNSILQVLVFCVPFFGFLDQVGKRAVHSFKSDTPLVEAMIMFMREFKVIDSAASVKQLRLRLKDNELEQYGDAFIPEYVYDVIKRLPRFSSMRRGHQQDAEEFLGFLLEGLHDECTLVIKKQTPAAASITSPNADTPDGWLEVGHKQKASVTQSSGSNTESPITKIFGGKLRSEFRVPGLQTSVTLEPYQPLQLDIGAADVHNITDALKGLTRSETITGNFNSPRGATTATKQVFIETLPPVLILHLKRFQYDNAGGTQKIWKKIGYPLELEIPKEVFSPHRRGALTARPAGLPKYRLIGVVYHHGKNASGGHYTVDVRRQEGQEWIRMDDTIIRRVRSEDVANEGGEEDPKILAKALEQHKRDDEDASKNLYSGFATDDEEEDNETGWSQVNGHAKDAAQKKWSSVANGSVTPSTVSTGKATPKDTGKYHIKDNKVAYILFYQQVQS